MGPKRRMIVEKTSGLFASEVVTKILTNELKYIDSDESVVVGVFTNCRECGHTYKVMKRDGTSFTWCVYEHRISDSIIINGKEGYISMNGDLPYNEDSNYDSFAYNELYKCAEKLKEKIKEFLGIEE